MQNESNAAPGFDLNRPSLCRTLPGGGWIGMYLDEPGVYYGPSGCPASDEDARLAGYDIDGHRKEAEKQRRLAEAKERIEREYREEQQRVEGQLDEVVTRDHQSEEDSGLVRIERGSPEGNTRGTHRMKYSVVESGTGRMLMKDVTRREAEEYAQEVNARGYVSVPLSEPV